MVIYVPKDVLYRVVITKDEVLHSAVIQRPADVVKDALYSVVIRARYIKDYKQSLRQGMLY